MKLSQTQLSQLDNILRNHFYYYSNPNVKHDSDTIYNESYINIMFDAWKKINHSITQRTSPYGKYNKHFFEERKNNCRETSRDKILKLNSRHKVKTDFYDLADFNRWEKIRTFIKPKSQREIDDEEYVKFSQKLFNDL